MRLDNNSPEGNFTASGHAIFLYGKFENYEKYAFKILGTSPRPMS